MNRQTGQDVIRQRYSEEQVLGWLSWLARGMQQHDQSIFLIEKLQPSWLSRRRQLWAYILASRVLWGVLSGLVCGLIGGLVFGFEGDAAVSLGIGLIVGFVFGLSIGLLSGLLDMVWKGAPSNFSTQTKRTRLWHVLRGIGVLGLIAGLVGGLVAGWVVGPDDPTTGVVLGIAAAILFGAIGGPVWVLRGQGRGLNNEIETVETVRFRWRAFPKGFWTGLPVGATLGILVGGATEIISAVSSQIAVELDGLLLLALVFGAAGSVLFGVLVGLLSCIQPSIRDLKTIPNQGIWLSLRSAALVGGVGGLALGIAVGLFGGWANGLGYGLLGGLYFAAWYGGLDVIQHYVVRLLLWRAGSMPWDLARFLDYAADELNFLQKVGGGYIFVHRYLLEYFAAMATSDTRAAKAEPSKAGTMA